MKVTNRVKVPLWLVLLGCAILGVSMAIVIPMTTHSPVRQERVIVYCAQDEVYAEPILQDFEKETDIKVETVYDSEAVKTVGLANRLLAERRHPQCDVFWGNEEMRTRQLGRMGVWRETNGFVAFGARARCLVVNTNLVAPDAMPHSLIELTNEAWRGKLAMAFPQFGTTATQLHVLRQRWGDERWQQWCRALVANGTKVVDGNSVVVKLVGQGEAWIGLTDTDDVMAGQREGFPVVRGPNLGEAGLFIPNTVGLVRDAPDPDNAEKLAAYLQRPETIQRLVDAGAIQFAAIPPDTETPKTDWDALFKQFDTTTKELNEIFLR